jgi:hypothetical protein
VTRWLIGVNHSLKSVARISGPLKRKQMDGLLALWDCMPQLLSCHFRHVLKSAGGCPRQPGERAMPLRQQKRRYDLDLRC